MAVPCQDGPNVTNGFPFFPNEIYYTEEGTPYFKECGVAMIGRTQTNLNPVFGFLHDFGESSKFTEYLDDCTDAGDLDNGALLAKFAGQNCYQSFGPARTWNKDADRYFANIRSQKHWSVIEHASYTFLFWGVDRSLTHELVRHRHFSFCLSAETLIYSDHFCKGKRIRPQKRTIEQIYNMKLTPHGRSRLKLMKLRCHDGKGGLTSTRITDVVCSGVKKLYKITMANGRSIRSSIDHRFYSRNGWKTVGDLVVGDELATNGTIGYKSKEWMKTKYHDENLSQEDIGNLCGVSKHCIRTWVRKHGLTKPMGSWTVGKTPWNKDKAHPHPVEWTDEMRINMSEKMTGSGNHRWKGENAKPNSGRVRANKLYTDLGACDKCGGTEKLHRHHIDRNTLNNTPSNIRILCAGCHKRLHAEEDGMESNMGICWSKIISITEDGDGMTYDIEVEHPEQNFIANGIVTHNSQLSQRYCDGKSLRFVERPEYQPERLQADASAELREWVEELHESFEEGIDKTVREYDNIAERLIEATKAGHVFLQGKSKTELRKHTNQTARELLCNSTEAPIVVSGNARSWREFVDKRATAAADVPIRELAIKVLKCLAHVSPLLFDDYEITSLDNGTEVAKAKEAY